MKTLGTFQRASHWACLCGKLFSLLLIVVAVRAHAGPLVTTDSPIGFFTNIASRLLSAQMGLDLNHIQVYPTNQYTPAVHRVLQVTANLYDAATNRPLAGDYPFLPTVFRPLFRRDANGAVFIAGYCEVTNDAVADFSNSGPPNVVLGVNQDSVPLVTMPFGAAGIEPLVQGIPLVIGARKGLPNFNEFAEQTSVLVSRKLQFRRQGTSNTSAIVETNQMYLVSITNTCGVEVWNSYVQSYPRNLELRLDAVMVAVVTNEYGMLLLSNATTMSPASALIPTNSWTGVTSPSMSSPASFKAYLTNFLVLPNSMYSDSQHCFYTYLDFERGNGFPVPHWYLSLRPMLRFALVDTSVSPARLVDYVSLDSPQAPADLTTMLMGAGSCGSLDYTPSGSPDAMWCTNRLGGFGSVFAPTYGILNQLGVALAQVQSSQWNINAHKAEVDFFRMQFQLASLFYPDGTFSLTNTFYCPYVPVRLISLYTSWQANDPLVHYTIPDLTDRLSQQPTYELDTTGFSPLAELGGLDFFTGQSIGAAVPLNTHYRPWGANPLHPADTTPPTNWKLGLKDPLVRWSDDWDFPTNPPLADLSWLGRVHRGTPWQTLYLKSSPVDLTTWVAWTGDALVTNYGIPGAPTVFDAAFTYPSNDWHLVSWLISLLSPNDPRSLLSVNEPAVAAWTSALDGIVALTNTASDNQLAAYRGLGGEQFDTVLVQSNTPQAWSLAEAITTARGSQPGQRFGDLGDILAVPELSVASPFLNQGSAINIYVQSPRYTYQQTWGLSDAAYEAVPAQLLLRLRPDSVASIVPGTGPLQVQFTGADGYRYAVEVSSNLVDWVGVSTNSPSNGRFLFQEAQPDTAARRFYRSSLLP